MSQFSVTTLNLGGVILSTQGNDLYVGGVPVQEGFFQTSRLNLLTTGSYPLISGVPSGYLYMLNSVECIFVNSGTFSGQFPSFVVGTGRVNTTNASLISGVNFAFISGVSFGDRFIYDVPTNAISGNVFLGITTSGKALTPISGYFVARGYFLKYV